MYKCLDQVFEEEIIDMDDTVREYLCPYCGEYHSEDIDICPTIDK